MLIISKEHLQYTKSDQKSVCYKFWFFHAHKKEDSLCAQWIRGRDCRCHKLNPMIRPVHYIDRDELKSMVEWNQYNFECPPIEDIVFSKNSDTKTEFDKEWIDKEYNGQWKNKLTELNQHYNRNWPRLHYKQRMGVVQNNYKRLSDYNHIYKDKSNFKQYQKKYDNFIGEAPPKH